MKKCLALLLICSLMVSVFLSAVAEKQEPEVCTSGDWEYILPEDGTAEIKGYSNKEAETVVIPEELDGKRVTGIGENAFSGHESLKSITIPDSVTSVAANPFLNCKSLTEIVVSPEHPVFATMNGVLFDKTEKRLICCPGAYTEDYYEIPEGIRMIGDYAFFSCKSLTSITIPNSVTSIGASSFAFCGHLRNITIPASVVSIGEKAFFYCRSFTNITIPDSVVCIEPYTFSDCSSLSNITIPDSVTSIGKGAFQNCKSLATITIPDSVKSIGVNPFLFCESLTNIIVSPEHPVLATIDGVLFDKAEKRLICYPGAYTDEHYEIPEGVRMIGNDAFAGCGSLAGITIPDSVTGIGDSAFYGCGSLADITIPDSVTSIGNDAFKECKSLTGITIPDGVTGIGDRVFYGCHSVIYIAIPDSVTSIGNDAFSYCLSLTGITIPDNVMSIGDDAFYGCDSLTVTVGRDSYAAQYCKDDEINYQYPDAND